MIASSSREANSASALGFDSLFGALAWGLTLLLLLAAPAQWANFWPADYNFWPQALFLLLIAGAAILLAIARLPLPRFDGVALFLSLFLGWNLLTVFTASYTHDAWLELARVTGALAFFWIIRAFPTRAQKMVLVAAAVVGVGWVGGGALFNFVQTRDPRQFGSFFNPNMFANALAVALPLALILPVGAWNETRSRNAATSAALPFLILLPALAVTSSKGGFVAAMLGLLVAVAMLRAARPAAFGVALKRALPALLILSIIFGALAAKTVVPRLLAARGSDDNSTMFRVYLWRGTFEMIQAKPIVGFGPGNFAGSYPRFAPAGPSKSAHQSWLQIAAESGVPALLLLAATFGLAFRNGWRARRDDGWALRAGALGALAALLVHGCFDDGWRATPVLIIAALALGCLQRQSELTTPPRGNLNLGWIGATLLLGLAGYGSQSAAQGQDAYDESQRLLERQAPAQALAMAQKSVDLDAGSARFQSNLGYLQFLNGGDGDAALQRAIESQRDRAANYFTLARVAAARNRPDLYEKWMGAALEREPKSSYFLLSRAKWRLEYKDGRGYDDLETLMRLWDAPYGRYPALADQINLDFARGVAVLAPRLVATGKAPRARKLIGHALKDIAAARPNIARNREIARAVGTSGGLDLYPDIDALENGLRQLQKSS